MIFPFVCCYFDNKHPTRRTDHAIQEIEISAVVYTVGPVVAPGNQREIVAVAAAGLLLFPRPVRKPLPELKTTPPVPAQSAVPVEQEFHVLRSAELERELLEFTAAGSNMGWGQNGDDSYNDE